MRLFLVFFVVSVICCFPARAQQSLEEKNCCIVFVHIGSNIPPYLLVAVEQAFVFNQTVPIHIIAERQALNSINWPSYVNCINTEDLPLTREHYAFIQNVLHSGFWRVTLERFLYLDDFIQKNNCKNVFHLENDVMLYLDLKEKLHAFETCYNGMVASTADCDERFVPGLVYVNNATASNKLSQYITSRAACYGNDMELLMQFKNVYYKQHMDYLPILVPSYDRLLKNLSGRTMGRRHLYYTNIDKLGAIFDAAALGQFFVGIDPKIGPDKPGFLAELSVFNAKYFGFRWEKDVCGRWVPFISYAQEEYPIANLHVHCKNLQYFYSLNKTPPIIPDQYWSTLPLFEVPQIKRLSRAR